MLIDAPWDYEVRSEKGLGKSPNRHYETMSVEEIASLPVSLLAAKDCALFAWVTWPLAMRWGEVIDAWGFQFSGLAWEWIKYNAATDKYAFGGGYGTRKNVEPCLLCTRGNPKIKADQTFFGEVIPADGSRSVRDFIQAWPQDAIRAKRRQHSRKPDEQYERIERLFEGPYVELFGRTRRAGWTSWGNQLGMFEEGA
ncbi:MAG: MT-A70 family methyltransferase [Rhodospirillaceae bacterium]